MSAFRTGGKGGGSQRARRIVGSMRDDGQPLNSAFILCPDGDEMPVNAEELARVIELVDPSSPGRSLRRLGALTASRTACAGMSSTPA